MITFAYIGINPGCGCVTAIVVDEPDHPMDTARNVFEILASGRRIERHPLEEVRARLAPCEHPKPWQRPVDLAPGETADDAAAEVECQYVEEQRDVFERERDRALDRVDQLTERIFDIERGLITPADARRTTELEGARAR